MTTAIMPGKVLWRYRLRKAGSVAGSAALSMLRGRAMPVVQHVREHFYSIAGIAFIDSASFVHSEFTGLLVTGISFLVFEWKVSEGE